MSLLEIGYAEALYGAAGGENAEIVGGEISSFLDALNSDELFGKYFKSPVVSSEQKKKVINEVLPPETNKITKNFLFLLIDNKRFGMFSAVAENYLRLMPENKDKKRIKIFSAKPLDKSSLDAVAEKYKGNSDFADVETEVVVDPALIGGICVQSGDMRYDGTLKTKLKRLNEKLTQSSL
jgi:F-type H+-transporting ATPase subunit delta